MKPADPGRLCLGEFQITDSMPVLVIGLFLFPFSSWFWFGLGRLHISKSLSIPSRWSILWACSQGPLEGSPDPAMLLSAAAGPSPLTVCPLAPTAPSVAPSGLSGGGGAPGELTVTWTVSSEDRGRNMPALLWEGGSPRPAAHPAPGTHLRRGAACREGPTGPLRGPDSGANAGPCPRCRGKPQSGGTQFRGSRGRRTGGAGGRCLSPTPSLAPSPCPGSTSTEAASATWCPSAGRAAPAGRPRGCPVPTPSTSSTATTASGPTRPLKSRSAATTAAGTGPRASWPSCTRPRKVGRRGRQAPPPLRLVCGV